MFSPDDFLEQLLAKWIRKLQEEKEEIVLLSKSLHVNKGELEKAVTYLDYKIAELRMIKELISSGVEGSRGDLTNVI